jgi:hypothetical protein
MSIHASMRMEETVTEANFSFTTKVNGDLFTVRGNTIDEFKENLVSCVVTEIGEHVKSLQESLNGGASPQSAIDTAAKYLGAVATGTAAPSPAPKASSSSTAPVCKHGQMTGRSGQGAKGPWKAWMCPSPKGTADQCEPQWVRRDTPDWALIA